jgi:hypothetical protein
MNNGQEQDDNPFMIDRQINEYDTRLKQLVKLTASSDSEERSKYYVEIASIGKRIEELKTKKKSIKIGSDIDEKANVICDFTEALPSGVTKFDDNVVRQLVDVVRVTGKGKVEIVFKGGDEGKSDGVIREVL